MNKKFLAASIAMTLSACGGGGGSSTGAASSTETVAGLNLPSSMSVVTASNTTSSRVAMKVPTDAGTDYSTDSSNAYVYDASMESLQTVNMILCLMDQTRATDMVNKGAYIALVNEDKCEQGQNQSSSGTTGQSSSGQATEYNNWTIESTRTANDAAQTVKIWVPGEQGGDPRDSQVILVEVIATEAVSDTKPFGSFSLNFAGVVDAGDVGGVAGQEKTIMTGTLATVDNSLGQPQFSFVSLDGNSIPGISGLNFSREEASNVILDDANGTGGVALTSRIESNSENGNTFSSDESYAIAFNSTHLLRGKDTNGDDTAESQSCKSRTNFNSQVWRYNLYHAADGTFAGAAVTGGERVKLNSGFPFTYDSNSDGTDNEHGWVGYHGVWAGHSTLADGTTITQFDYDTDTKKTHTVNVSNGKMVRRSANTELLSSYQGDEFQYWGNHPILSINGQWVVTIDSSNAFQITGAMSRENNNAPQISPTVDINGNPTSVAATITLSDHENLWLWSDALGGNVAYVHDVSVAQANRMVTYYAEEFITPADTTLFPSGTTSVSLYCYDRCLKGGLDQSDVTAATSESDLYYAYSGTPFVYTISMSDGKVTLTDDSNANAVVSAIGLNMSKFGNDWGINTGEMLTTQLANANEPWAVFNEAVTYRWETGDNDWNRLVTVTDASGNVAKFDRPIQFNYTHSTANDANGDTANDGKKFLIEYAGPGELHGFPWVENSETHRWHSSVTLKNGTTLTDGTNSFVVKAIEMEQTMQDDANNCGALNIDSLFTDTALALPTASSMGTVSFTVADKPVVTAAPAVVEGELK